ncbi:molybdopterin converting factor, subunit 2 [Cyanobium sp. PCC 7001]|uniref:molybdenum cofactor biosynthesis protein MoaE n=1 Tax=Cyanobium sp. PCC 7001 TaxID=180281 RepID=UPI0001805C1D|nr:molybdenum cofactor biosynthesis protein MoaE [Cyanobium sp. PCC 7001]EDY38874.1 molybdopterin converting factor, subunit 2 [Cyanobium sp. PCC 7001]
MQLCIALHAEAFDPLQVLQEWQHGLQEHAGGAPAAEAVFIGRVRGQSSGGEALAALELEHYPGMTEHCLHRQARQLGEVHGVAGVLIRHRVGAVLPGETIVLVAVVADRRGQAQRCAQALLEALKHDAPFWKREHLSSGGGRWVEGNTAY